MSRLVALGLGCALEVAIGDPEGWPHPIRGVGWMITRGEEVARRHCGEPRSAGVVLVMGVLAATMMPVLLARDRLRFFGSRALGIFDGLVLYLALSAHQLIREGLQIQRLLEDGEIARARRELSRLVSRRTEELDEAGVVKATIETMAENFADGFFNPLFYFVVAGPAGAVAYKVVNTMDSMIGYRNERYLEFGRAAARLDDIVNWLPARMAGLVLVAAAPLAGYSAANAWRIMARDARRHESPNAGIGKAAVAGALGVQIGGAARYGDAIIERPFIGDDERSLEPTRIRDTARLLLAGCVVSVVLAWAWLRR